MAPFLHRARRYSYALSPSSFVLQVAPRPENTATSSTFPLEFHRSNLKLSIVSADFLQPLHGLIFKHNTPHLAAAGIKGMRIQLGLGSAQPVSNFMRQRLGFPAACGGSALPPFHFISWTMHPCLDDRRNNFRTLHLSLNYQKSYKP